MEKRNKIQLIFTLIMATLFLGACGKPDLTGGAAATNIEDVPTGLAYIDGVGPGETRLFVTESAFPSNFIDVPGATSGLDGADIRCQEAAQNAGLKRNYCALLGSSTRSPASMIPALNSIYILISDSQRLKTANDAAQLWNASSEALQIAPNITENYKSLLENPIDESFYPQVSDFNSCIDVGVDLMLGEIEFPFFYPNMLGISCLNAPEYIAQLVYSGSTDQGDARSDHCKEWTQGSGSILSDPSDAATVGFNSSQNRNWIYAGAIPCASLSAHLYCVSQD